MDKEDILKYNKMIGEFMGGMSHENEKSFIKEHIGLNELNFQPNNYPEKNHDGSCWTFNELKYHCSMDWLLPVVDRIKFYEQVSITSDNSQWECAIETPGYHYATQAFEVDSDLISCVWRACVEYINKVNTNTLTVSKK